MYRVGVGVGGTFTDFVLFNEADRVVSYFKQPSTPNDLSIAIAEGVRRLLDLAGIKASEIGYFGHGTTVATNMVIERRGVPTGLITTKGFRDVLAIGRQTRPSLYDYGVRKPAPLVERYRRLEADERLGSDGEVLRSLDEAQVERLVRELIETGCAAIAVSFIHSYRDSTHETLARRVIERIAPQAYISLSSEVLPEFRACR